MFLTLMFAFAIGGLVQVDHEARDKYAQLVREALRLADISPEKAAIYMCMDRAQFDRQLKGEGHISMTRLMALPEEFWRWFCFLGAGELGLPACVERARTVWMALTKRRKPARMSLHVERESAEKRSA